jgi:hypothetical protein
LVLERNRILFLVVEFALVYCVGEAVEFYPEFFPALDSFPPLEVVAAHVAPCFENEPEDEQDSGLGNAVC